MMIIFKKKGTKFEQKSYDFLFLSIENNLRELGFGDVAVNKKMKDLNKILYDILLKIEQKDEESAITPTISQPQVKKKITREDSISSSQRIKVENDSVVGSINLKGALIDDISFKKHKQKVEDQKNIVFFKPI